MTFEELDYVETLDGSIKGVITSILNGWYEVEYVSEHGTTCTKKFRAKQLKLWSHYTENIRYGWSTPRPMPELHVYGIRVELQDNTVLWATLSQKFTSASAASEHVAQTLNTVRGVGGRVVTVGERGFLIDNLRQYNVYLKKDQREG